MSHNAETWKFKCPLNKIRDPVELKHCKTSVSLRVFYLTKLKLWSKKGKVCMQAKWPIRPELILVSVAQSN